MPVLNIRIVELMTQEKKSAINYLHFLTHTNDNPNKIIKMKITTNKKGNVQICEKPISLNIGIQKNNFIHMDFKRHRMLISDDLLGRVVLPLDWFPTNHVVREWFPISKKARGVCDTMILLDVHVDSRNVQPFMAPFATLKVVPSWQRPTLCENSEIVVNPPVIYVISPPPNYVSQTNHNPNTPPHYETYQQNQGYPCYPQFVPKAQQPVDYQTYQNANIYQMNLNQQNQHYNHSQSMYQNNESHLQQMAVPETQMNVNNKKSENEPFADSDLMTDQQISVYYPKLQQYPNPYKQKTFNDGYDQIHNPYNAVFDESEK
ncbi:hypothetical protein M9Y10_014016 [Tritrichomonas musculus]|uniref:Uncharacterized protein n=1 Tax=Tritrichomonas musculus TaxID=1915356 RepID=A0ABR2KYC5_9EUKA